MTCIGPYKRHRVCLFGRKLDGTRICVRCGSLGPARDTPAVMIEIRAAEIAARHHDSVTVNELFAAEDRGAEYAGWIEHAHDSAKVPEQPGEWAGWLSRCIVKHGDEP